MNTLLAAIVEYNAQSGTVTFLPGSLVGPVVTVVLAIISAASVLVVVYVGTGWLYELFWRATHAEEMADADWEDARSQQIEREAEERAMAIENGLHGTAPGYAQDRFKGSFGGRGRR